MGYEIEGVEGRRQRQHRRWSELEQIRRCLQWGSTNIGHCIEGASIKRLIPFGEKKVCADQEMRICSVRFAESRSSAVYHLQRKRGLADKVVSNTFV